MTELALRASEVPASFDQQMRMASVLAESTLLPGHLRGKPANVLVVLQGARALDISAFWAFQSMHVVDGKLGLAAELMRAMVIKAGHKFRVVERTADRAVVEIHRNDRDQPYRAEFTSDDAKRAELTGKDNWRKYPKSMLVARATSIAVRDECPETLFGMVYTPDELGAETDRDGAPIITEDGRVIVKGQAVPPPTDAEIAGWAAALEDWPLDALPAVWVEVSNRAALFATPGQGDDSLYDLLIARIVVEVEAARCRPEVRQLFDLCKVLQLRDARHPDGQWLRDFMVSVGEQLPEKCSPDPADGETVPAEGEGLGDAGTGAQGGAEAVDTPTAEALRQQAAESWGEDDETAQTPMPTAALAAGVEAIDAVLDMGSAMGVGPRRGPGGREALAEVVHELRTKHPEVFVGEVIARGDGA